MICLLSCSGLWYYPKALNFAITKDSITSTTDLLSLSTTGLPFFLPFTFSPHCSVIWFCSPRSMVCLHLFFYSLVLSCFVREITVIFPSPSDLRWCFHFYPRLTNCKIASFLLLFFFICPALSYPFSVLFPSPLFLFIISFPLYIPLFPLFSLPHPFASFPYLPQCLGITPGCVQGIMLCQRSILNLLHAKFVL